MILNILYIYISDILKYPITMKFPITPPEIGQVAAISKLNAFNTLKINRLKGNGRSKIYNLGSTSTVPHR
jgi:hypothetical protein